MVKSILPTYKNLVDLATDKTKIRFKGYFVNPNNFEAMAHFVYDDVLYETRKEYLDDYIGKRM